jgi:hypothetical protein
MILYSGYKSDTHEFGTGLYIVIYIMDNLSDSEPVNEIICKIKVKLKYYNLTLISTHAPSEEKEDIVREEFYSSLEKVCEEVPNYDMKIELGDFNTKVGKSSILSSLCNETTIMEN